MSCNSSGICAFGNSWWWIIILVVAAGAGTGIAVWRKKKDKE